MTSKKAGISMIPQNVADQVASLQGEQTPGATGPQSKFQSMISKFMGDNSKVKGDGDGDGDGKSPTSDPDSKQVQDPYYPSANGTEHQYSETGRGVLSKNGANLFKPPITVPDKGKEMKPSMKKGKSPTAVAQSSLLKGASKLCLSSFFGGVLDSKEKLASTSLNDLDPELLFNDLVGRLKFGSNDYTEDERDEVREDFIDAWNTSGE